MITPHLDAQRLTGWLVQTAQGASAPAYVFRCCDQAWMNMGDWNSCKTISESSLENAMRRASFRSCVLVL